jgi:hypothetical protein
VEGADDTTRAVFRRANEDLFELSGELLADLPGELAPFLCECADRTCTRVVRLLREEFEDMRSQPGWFVVLPGHEGGAGATQVIRREERFSVVRAAGAGTPA